MSSAFLESSSGETWKLEGAEAVIGREPPATVVIAMAVVSRQHARLEPFSKGYGISDLGSRNGTFVNGKAVGSESTILQDGAEIVVGGAVTLFFRDPGETRGGRRVGRLKGLWIDPENQDVWVDAIKIEPPLSAAQQQFLQLLYSKPGQIFTRDQVVGAVWADNEAVGVSEEAIDGLVKRLRSRLGAGGAWIKVERGRGFRLLDS